MTQPAETKNPGVMSGRESPFRWRHPSPFLLPLAAVFRAAVALRHAAYRRGWLKTRHLTRPVISVGNLTVGGTGKTPLVAWLARRLLASGHKPSILTRGYGRRGTRMIVLAPQPGRIPDPREVGDEPAWLARKLPEVPIIVGVDRYEAGRVAEDRFRVDIHVLDDGFSHLALARDIDLVILDSTVDLSREALLPAGRRREPCGALTRADLVVLTRTEIADPAPLEARIGDANPHARVFHSRTKLCRLVEGRSGTARAPDALKEKPVYAFCGIGNPGAFLSNLQGWGFSIAGFEPFRDHHVYRDAELRQLSARARESGAGALVTTEKDAMNLPANWPAELPVVVCEIEAEIREAQAFEDALLASLRGRDEERAR